MSGGTSKEVKKRGGSGVCYTSPSTESERVGVYQDPRAPYLYHPSDLRPLIAALVSDCSVRLRTTGPNRMIFFLIEILGWGVEDLPEESWVCCESRVSGELQSRKERHDRRFTYDGGTD